MGLIMFKYDLFMTEQKEGETDSSKEKKTESGQFHLWQRMSLLSCGGTQVTWQVHPWSTIPRAQHTKTLIA